MAVAVLECPVTDVDTTDLLFDGFGPTTHASPLVRLAADAVGNLIAETPDRRLPQPYAQLVDVIHTSMGLICGYLAVQDAHGSEYALQRLAYLNSASLLASSGPAEPDYDLHELLDELRCEVEMIRGQQADAAHRLAEKKRLHRAANARRHQAGQLPHRWREPKPKSYMIWVEAIIALAEPTAAALAELTERLRA